MSDVKTFQSGDFCWIELCAPVMQSAKDFYMPLFNWQFSAMPMPGGGDYFFLETAGTPIGGGYELTSALSEAGCKPAWCVYVQTDDADALTQRAETLGAIILKPAFDVGDMGRMSVLQDPTGAVFSFWQPKGESAPRLSPRSHGAIGWIELATRDIEKAQAFYCDLLGWDAQKSVMPSGKEYVEFSNQGQPVAGMYRLTEEMRDVPPHWGIYFSVEDLDAALRQAREMGAEVLYDPIHLPELGRFTAVKDPQQICFSLIEFE